MWYWDDGLISNTGYRVTVHFAVTRFLSKPLRMIWCRSRLFQLCAPVQICRISIARKYSNFFSFVHWHLSDRFIKNKLNNKYEYSMVLRIYSWGCSKFARACSTIQSSLSVSLLLDRIVCSVYYIGYIVVVCKGEHCYDRQLLRSVGNKRGTNRVGFDETGERVRDKTGDPKRVGLLAPIV